MKVTIALLALQSIGAQDMPWPGVLNLEHIKDGIILAEATPEPTAPESTEPEPSSPQGNTPTATPEKPSEPSKPEFIMVNTGLEDWKITQFHHYDEPSFLQANITLDPFSDKTEADN